MTHLADTQELAAEVARLWPRAQAHWSQFMLLSDPIDDSTQLGVAQIDLASRQISLNLKLISQQGLGNSLEAMLAHEIGHHVRYPGSTVVQARLRLLERALLPLEDYSLVNMFTDVMINERIGHELSDQLARVYRSFTGQEQFHGQRGWQRDPAFVFYLSIYEQLWRLAPGSLIGPAAGEFNRIYPKHRAEAQLLAENLFRLGPNLFTQFMYFVSVVSRYVKPLQGELPESRDPYSCGCGEPTPEDWAAAITPSPRELDAIGQAEEEGWISRRQADGLRDHEELAKRISGLPGTGGSCAAQVSDVMAAYYRQQAGRYLFRPPPQPALGEAMVPTTVEDWEPGDATGDIDWLTTLLERGEVLGCALPLRRARIAEHEGQQTGHWQPRVELYLDVSGSMPDPRTQRNAMTLAAQVLTLGTLRAGGRVRAAIYSSTTLTYWTWCRSETEMSRFLVQYLGSGTEFPFELLAESVQQCGREQPIRVIISDTDFDSNYEQQPGHAAIFADAVCNSPAVVMLMHRPAHKYMARYSRLGAKVIQIARMDDYPKMAADLTLALFPDSAHR